LQTPAPTAPIVTPPPEKKGVGLGTKIALLTIIIGGVIGGLYAAGVFHH
jgi:hypothetical protein